MVNRGDSTSGRFKASVTRAVRPKAPAMKSAAPVLPRAETPDTTLKTPAAPMGKVGGPMMKKAQKSRTFRFLGSFKNGGHVHRTGLYLLHKNERVHPAKLTKAR